MRHASEQVNHRRLKELQQVIQPHTHTHTHTHTKECTADHLCLVQSQYNHSHGSNQTNETTYMMWFSVPWAKPPDDLGGCKDILSIQSEIKHVWHSAGRTTSTAKQLWAPAISPVWSKSEKIRLQNKASDSAPGSLCTSAPSRSLLAKPQIHQRPGELYATQWAHCRRWGNTIIVTIFPFRWKRKHTHLWLTVTFWEVCGFFAVVADIMRRNVGGSLAPEVKAGPEKKLLFG